MKPVPNGGNGNARSIRERDGECRSARAGDDKRIMSITSSNKSDSVGKSVENANSGAKRAGLLARWRARLFGSRDSSLRESLEDVIEQHEQSVEDFSPEERSMLLNILGFGEKTVEDVMVPRADITSIDQAATIGELMTIFKRAGHSRLPVYRDTLDDLIGMVHIKDVMGWLTAVAQKPPKNRAKKPLENTDIPKLRLDSVNLAKTLSQVRLHREVLFVPPSMPAVDMLVKMQATRIHMAIVVDEYGGTDGLVSIEDLVEEIVGEIEDEHDVDVGPSIIEDGPGRFIADARIELDDIATYPGLSALAERDDDIETLGGLVFSLVGRVPVRGELIAHQSGLEFEVLDADPRRLKRLRLHLQAKTSRLVKESRPKPSKPAAKHKSK